MLSCVCVLSIDAGATLVVHADNTSTNTEDGQETVLGSSTVVGGKAVVMVNPSQMYVRQPGEGEEPEGDAESESGTESSAAYTPQFKEVRDGKIVDAAYYKKASLSQYIFPAETINAIGDFAFARSGLTGITIPDTVTRIGYGAFYHCDSLTAVEIPASVTDIEPYAFEKTGWVEKWRAEQQSVVAAGNESFLVVGDGILIAYEGNKKRVTIPATVKKIAGSVFQGRGDITSVIFPATLTEIGESAFEDCSSLTSIGGAKNLKVIRDKAFCGCPLTEIQIPETVTEIGMDAFDLKGVQGLASQPVVVFQGMKLPGISYTNRATRLSNTTYRERAFEGVPIAVVRKEITNVNGTVLDENVYGFAGIICRMDSNSAAAKEGTLTIIKVNGKVSSYPETLLILGRTYKVQDPDGLVAKSVEFPLSPGLTMKVASDNLKPENLLSFKLSSLPTAFEVTIEENNTVDSALKDAYAETYGTDVPEQFYAFEIRLEDKRAHVPVHKLGEQEMTVTLPLASGLDSGLLHLAMLDDYGFLKEIEFTVQKKQGVACITFSMDRVTSIAMYQ